MWKSIALCASLFGGAAMGLAAATRWIEPAALSATVAFGLCLIGAVLIWAAPAAPRATLDGDEPRPLATHQLRPALARSQPDLEALDVRPVDPTGITEELPTITG
ncbi:MAG TPA: hypothetical protein VFF06_30005 [Polyangia bacterium]|nr:hypothetical protein [Polyangia bacterium]